MSRSSCRLPGARGGVWALLGLTLAVGEPRPPDLSARLAPEEPVVNSPASDEDSGGLPPCCFGVMSPPKVISSAPVIYPPEAVRARVRGLVVVQCIVTLEGRAEDCRILKGLPHLDAAVLSAMALRRYRPITKCGNPFRARFTFNLRLEPP